MPVTIGGTNIPGDAARLFPWQVVHYIVRGGPNDPTIQTNSPPTQGGWLSANIIGSTSIQNTVTLPPIPGTQSPPNVPLPRTQIVAAGGSTTNGASYAAPTLTNATGALAGGVYLGTIPQGSWIESAEMYLYTAFGSTAANIIAAGIFYAPADTAPVANAPGFQPATLYALGALSQAAATTIGAANTLYSTEAATGSIGRTLFSASSVQVGPGNGNSGSLPAALASLSDIDLYFVVAMSNAATGTLNAGCASVRIKFTGLEG